MTAVSDFSTNGRHRNGEMLSPLERIDESDYESAWENFPSHDRHSPVDFSDANSTFSSDAATLRTQKSSFDQPKLQPESISDDDVTTAVPTQAQWGIHWKSPTLMLSLFFFGVGCCIGHHFFYQFLDGKPVESSITQQWAIRIGTGLAFLAKASLAASVGVAFTQRLWVTLRTKALSLRAIDNVFSLAVDPTSFFNGEALTHAKLLCLLAAAMWCIPIIAIITPATLTVRLVTTVNTTNTNVPSLSYENARNWGEYQGAQRLIDAAIPVHRILAATATTGDILRTQPPFSNSSYTLDFFGPSLKCYNLSAADLDPEDESVVAPARKVYESVIEANMQRSNAPWAAHHIYLGATSNATNLTDTLFVNVQGLQEQNITCNVWNTSYTVLYDFTASPAQPPTITRLARTSPIQIAPNNTLPSYTPHEIAFFAWTRALHALLASSIDLSSASPSTLSNPSASLLQTNLASTREVLQRLNQTTSDTTTSTVAHTLEDLAQNFTLSLSASAWTAGTAPTTITTFRATTAYTYHALYLLVAYAAGVAAALAGLCVGAGAYLANGFAAGGASSSFSSVLLATRNQDLDRLVEGRCLPARGALLDGDGELGRTRLRYGVLAAKEKSVAGQEHAAFGFVGTVKTLRKGDVVA
ncbi:formylmethionine deformylase-like protein [Diplodia corticola]|uniref:Formylmethionine deformylase-like protein n=1 Tax=Diplodia corticola TaxID=236234 RepID=A0A1J9RFQ0_9PEZI|nr:formylmethionine deformylase-like protein [Diplodia corticola]OJD38906.1 formylmethionine deformylase-like protein [Diplodia corticola]